MNLVPPLSSASAREHLLEQRADWRSPDSQLDLARRLVTNIVLVSAQSRNGYSYSEAALRLAVPLYDAKPVFLDHAADPENPTDRSTRDVVGSVVRPRFESNRIVGDIELLDVEAARTFLALLESRSGSLGMSHVVLARRSTDGQVVEQIDDVISVDVVAFPAATSGFHEPAEPPASNVATPLETPPATANEHRRPLNPAFPQTPLPPCHTCARAAESSARVVRLERELAQIQLERDQELLSEVARLPASVVTSEFRRILQTCPPSARLALIRERADYAARLVPVPVSRSRSGTETQIDQTLLAALRQ